MWNTVFLVCVTVIFSCSAQVTKNEVNTVTETVRTNQDVEWDTTGPSVTLSIKDGRSETANRPLNELSNHPLFYSNQWQPFLMPIGLNSDGDINNGHRSEGEDSATHHFVPTFLRRPDSELNRTFSSRFRQLPNGFRYPFAPMPMAPINPLFFYPQQPSFSPTENYHASGIASQNSSVATSRPTISNTETTYLKDGKESIPSSSYAEIPDISERFNPMNPYRNRDDFSSPIAPAFFPYPVAPNANDNALHPVLFPFINSHVYDRQKDSDVIERISTGQEVTESEATTGSKIIDEQEGNVANDTPSDYAPTFIPPEPLPLPIAGFPLGVLPPPIFPPYIPVPTQQTSRVGDPVTLSKEAEISDVVQPQNPITANNPPLEKSPDILLTRNRLKSEELPAIIDTNAEIPVPDNRPSEAKIPYEFGFDMNDGQGTDQHRKEVSDISGTVRGSYGYRDMSGVYRFVNYIADKNGFRAFIKSNEPGVATSGSADVVVLAEQPPAQAIAEGENLADTEVVIIPDTATDLMAEGSDTKAA